ncbi:MAG: putative DNA modification/repair radical SAM protein [Desulfuromonadaceae bacterium]|nr:putative DNA modification/repair radical SAM protein [Desulfuromonadaceae bacterium]
MFLNTAQKLDILAASAKYDVSCSSSGSRRRGSPSGIGSAAVAGCCHSWSEDGRCISLLKILFSNVCIYDCAFCLNRRSNDIPRATFTVDEVAELTLEFYKRNYIEGLFLSSGIWRSPDDTMECLAKVAETLRFRHRFNGYIHLKAIPGADPNLIRRAGLAADRLSVNIELPTEKSLKLLAPDKTRQAILHPMRQIGEGIVENRAERKKFRKAPSFAPAGQSSQLVIGATPESDLQILHLTESLYNRFSLKRVYYSAYVPVNADSRLPALRQPPALREHRLYQADWLMRYYGFRAEEILTPSQPDLDEHFDPKTAWALRHPASFPVEIHSAGYETLLRVPGIGVTSAKRIIAARRYARLAVEDLQRIGVVLKRARFFITCGGRYGAEPKFNHSPERVRRELLTGSKRASDANQLRLFG